MDYVREELLRQQQVLETLMMGGTPEETEPQQEEPMRQREAEEQTGGIRREQRSLERRGIRGRGQSGLLEEELLALRGGAVFPEAEESAGFTEIVGVGSASRAQGTVREVSRAIERDARRYDGGFTMY